MTVVSLFPRHQRFCASCGFAFVPFAPTHRLCRKCHAYHRIGTYIAASRRLLEAAR